MKTVLFIGLLFWSFHAWATGPEYNSSRASIEQLCPTNQVPAKERVFIASCPGSPHPAFAMIVRHTKGMNLRDVIDSTRFKGTNPRVTVLRSKRRSVPVFDSQVLASDKPKFKLKPLDVIWICEPELPQ